MRLRNASEEERRLLRESSRDREHGSRRHHIIVQVLKSRRTFLCLLSIATTSLFGVAWDAARGARAPTPPPPTTARAKHDLIPAADLVDLPSQATRWSQHAHKPIPKVLHQSWPKRQVPRTLAAHMQSWRQLQPEWAFRFWTDSDNEDLVKQHYPWLLKAWQWLSPIQRADMARLLYMDRWGGVYADLDVQLLQPLAPLLAACEANGTGAIIGQEPLAHAVLLESKPRQACNAVLASAPGHPFWLWVARRAVAPLLAQEAGYLSDDPVETTGPRMLERAAALWEQAHGGGSAARRGSASGESGPRLLVTAPEAFYPLWDARQADSFREKCSAGEDSVASPLVRIFSSVCAALAKQNFEPRVPEFGAFTAHHWAHTWLGEEGTSWGERLVDVGPDTFAEPEAGGPTASHAGHDEQRDATLRTRARRPVNLGTALDRLAAALIS
jgi:mannosyltransferase OCH1-like enzyme